MKVPSLPTRWPLNFIMKIRWWLVNQCTSIFVFLSSIGTRFAVQVEIHLALEQNNFRGMNQPSRCRLHSIGWMQHLNFLPNLVSLFIAFMIGILHQKVLLLKNLKEILRHWFKQPNKSKMSLV